MGGTKRDLGREWTGISKIFGIETGAGFKLARTGESKTEIIFFTVNALTFAHEKTEGRNESKIPYDS